LPRGESQGKSVDGVAPDARPALRRHILVLPLIAALHMLLVLLLLQGLRMPDIAPPAVKPVQVVLDAPPPRPHQPPPKLRLAKPEKIDAAPPPIDIALSPQSPITATPRGIMAVAPGGGGDGNGAGTGRGSQRAALKVPAEPIDPSCETMDTYLASVRSAIERFFDYSQQARDAHVEGEVLAHFISDPRGRIQNSTVTTSSVERVYPGYRQGGHYVNWVVAFSRTGPNSWNWQALARPETGADVVLANGSVVAGADGELRPPDRTDGMMVVILPDDIPAGVPRIQLPFGRSADLLLLETSVQHALDRAQPLPAIPACLKLPMLNAMMPFRFHQHIRS
jgi:hypothetical protein